MTSNVDALGAVNDARGEGRSLVSKMNSALKPTISVMDAIKNDLVTASEPGADLNKVETDIAARQQSLLSIGGSANFNGRNRLETTGGNFNLVGPTIRRMGSAFSPSTQRIRRRSMPRLARPAASLDSLAQAPAPPSSR
jgi:flagellin